MSVDTVEDSRECLGAGVLSTNVFYSRVVVPFYDVTWALCYDDNVNSLTQTCTRSRHPSPLFHHEGDEIRIFHKKNQGSSVTYGAFTVRDHPVVRNLSPRPTTTPRVFLYLPSLNSFSVFRVFVFLLQFPWSSSFSS